VPSDDLSSIPGREDKHVRVLARQHVADLRGLIQADRRAIHRAMGNLRPRPTLEQISRWQDEARSKLEEAVTDTSEWHPAASFVVVFSQRHMDGAWERRVEVEQAEVEPERNLQLWSGWECDPICGWMRSQLGQAAAAASPSAGPPSAAPPSAAPTAPAPIPAMAAPGRAQLRIDSAAIIDARGRTDVLTGGALAVGLPAELTAPVRLILRVSGARPETRVLAVTRIQRRNGPGWNPQPPTAVPERGQAEFDLSGVPAGEHEMSLIAWVPDGTAKPVSVRLPAVRIREDPDRPPPT
jgi:hypothetical protein